ncbi:MAG: DEAD/DEAH box helicase family protein [Chloroflexi bacterium]|nr:DEAD/DEAH box helicase family protein [Chloroflexota bacterium]
MTQMAAAMGDIDPVYEIPADDLVGEVLVPAMSLARQARIASGYFSSRCLAQIAPGLAAYLRRSDIPLRLLISPELDEDDRAAVEEGIRTPQQVIDSLASTLLDSGSVSESALVRHTRDCLSYLLATRRLELRFVLMDRGMYHKKQWLLSDGDEWLAIHGSGNATGRGLLLNGEQMTIDRTWADGPSAQLRVSKLIQQWDRQWNDEDPNALTLRASDGLLVAGQGAVLGTAPTIEDFWSAWRQDFGAGIEPLSPSRTPQSNSRLLAVPSDLEWRSGRYSHQGQAVDAFLANESRGVLAIATGGGKTRTALLAATEMQRRHSGPMLIVVLVPSRPLMMQWAEDVREFGVEPVLPSDLNPQERHGRLLEVEAGLVGDRPVSEVLILTNSLFSQDEGVRNLLDRLPSQVEVFLVGDEMHNLGAPTHFRSLPERANSRLGLSATPIRQYDPDGTDRLFEYFGPQVFTFGLEEAIRAGCLTPYQYFLHEVPMTDRELDKWTELTEELTRAGFKRDDDGQVIGLTKRGERLLRDRRAVLEQASAKPHVLRQLLEEKGPTSIQRCLVYASSKAVVLDQGRQIERVNEMLSDLGIISHQFTSAETSRHTAAKLLEAFGRGDYQVLTAMKVLDEGIDIPQTDTAFILASSAVQREWVQRRGRILRRAPGKSMASVHDFIVVPPEPDSEEGASILRGELRRAEEFAALAENEWDSDGPRSIISKLEAHTWVRS